MTPPIVWVALEFFQFRAICQLGKLYWVSAWLYTVSCGNITPSFSNSKLYVLFFLFFFWRTHVSFFGPTGTPVLDFWWRLLWVLKPEWVLPYSLFWGGKCNVHSPRSIFVATHADLLAASSAAGHFPTCISRGGTWLGFKQAITQTEDECATIVSRWTRYHCVSDPAIYQILHCVKHYSYSCSIEKVSNCWISLVVPIVP